MTEPLEIRECSFDDNKEFRFAVADTGITLMRGLAGAESMGDSDGMLFDFGCDWSPFMTPKGLLFPVDLAFIDNEDKIVEIHVLDPAVPYPQGTECSDIRYALEVEKGFFQQHNIRIGDIIAFTNN